MTVWYTVTPSTYEAYLISSVSLTRTGYEGEVLVFSFHPLPGVTVLPLIGEGQEDDLLVSALEYLRVKGYATTLHIATNTLIQEDLSPLVSRALPEGILIAANKQFLELHSSGDTNFLVMAEDLKRADAIRKNYFNTDVMLIDVSDFFLPMVLGKGKGWATDYLNSRTDKYVHLPNTFNHRIITKQLPLLEIHNVIGLAIKANRAAIVNFEQHLHPANDPRYPSPTALQIPYEAYLAVATTIAGVKDETIVRLEANVKVMSRINKIIKAVRDGRS